ncbi:MAG: hypothetical protein ACFB6R_03890 [Alphaproteobacteria bacterium]
MVNFRTCALLGGILTLVSTASNAESDFAGLKLKNNLSFGVTAATTGFGPEIQVRVLPRLVLRGGYNYFRFGVDDDYDGVEYDAELNLSNFIVGADIHPFGNAFFISGGAFIGDKSVDLDGNTTEPVEIGDTTFSPDEIGTLSGEVELKAVAPFAGLGFDNTFSGGRVGFKIMAGVLFTGSPDATLVSSGGSLSDDPTLVAELQQEEQSLEEEIEDFQFYPLISLGLNIRL